MSATEITYSKNTDCVSPIRIADSVSAETSGSDDSEQPRNGKRVSRKKMDNSFIKCPRLHVPFLNP